MEIKNHDYHLFQLVMISAHSVNSVHLELIFYAKKMKDAASLR